MQVLRDYGRLVAHMRAERQDGRFGLILGSGVSAPLGFPSWPKLVASISEHPSVDGVHVVSGAGGRVPETSKTQMLFQHYRSKVLDTGGSVASAKLERQIQGEWRRIIQQCLYTPAVPCVADLGTSHPYLGSYLNIIAESSMTVNYNFDDTLQQLLLQRAASASDASRGFETVWNASLPSRPRSAILYHPNGYLPRNLLEYPSETLVLSEDSFADQLIESMSGHHASLVHHLAKTTCLLVGLSLQDATLRHLLRQGALANPGHYHFYVHWLSPGAARDPEAERAQTDANFEVYNLVTLFLDDPGLAALGRLLEMSEGDLRREAEELGVGLRYFYYLTGAIGAGKTTCLAYLRSFKTYDEWVEQRPPDLGRSWRDLTPDERVRLDHWIIQQFNLKNAKLLDQRTGIHLVDRTPLDPLAFTEPADVPAKAAAISRGLSPGHSVRRAQAGHVIRLVGSPDDMESRVIGRHKQSKAALIGEMQERLKVVFQSPDVSVVDTAGMSIPQVVKRVARIVLLEPHRAIDLSELLETIRTTCLAVPA